MGAIDTIEPQALRIRLRPHGWTPRLVPTTGTTEGYTRTGRPACASGPDRRARPGSKSCGNESANATTGRKLCPARTSSTLIQYYNHTEISEEDCHQDQLNPRHYS
uniref:(northern house mosquito) hypothetical protein n=1 Tax=Culex pipiens TaxID=7175 RepID=A0A8D8CQ18_CULPI